MRRRAPDREADPPGLCASAPAAGVVSLHAAVDLVPADAADRRRELDVYESTRRHTSSEPSNRLSVRAELPPELLGGVEPPATAAAAPQRDLGGESLEDDGAAGGCLEPAGAGGPADEHMGG